MTDTSTDASYRVTAEEQRQFIERFKHLEAEKKNIADLQQRDDGRRQVARLYITTTELLCE
ncbi:hypothetical protein [Roseovarius amoyensis]|uniref:hypothetical protein n=1 Tax=Roseovarius amoyensis TaxID=2211448 RepID=UPI0019550334